MRMNIIKRNLIAARIVLYLKQNDKAFYEGDNSQRPVYPLHICNAKEKFSNAEQAAQMLSDILNKKISAQHLNYVEEDDPNIMWAPFNAWMYDDTEGVFFVKKDEQEILFMDKRIWYNTQNIIVIHDEHWLWTVLYYTVLIGFLVWIVSRGL